MIDLSRESMCSLPIMIIAIFMSIAIGYCQLLEISCKMRKNRSIKRRAKNYLSKQKES